MRKTTKTISLILVLALIITAFAACAKGPQENTTESNTVQISTAPVDGEPSVNEEGASNGGEEPPVPAQENTGASQKPATGQEALEAFDSVNGGEEPPVPAQENAGASQKPATGQEALAVFNSIIGSRRLSCAFIEQKLTNGTIGTRDTVYIDFSDPKYQQVESEIDFREGFERSDKNGAALLKISSSDAASTQLNGTTLTVTLKDRSVSDFTGSSVNGYINIVDAARAQELGTKVKNILPALPGSVKLNSSALNLKGGKIVAQFNDDFTQLASVKISYSEGINAEFKYLGIHIIANLNYNITAEYR